MSDIPVHNLNGHVLYVCGGRCDGGACMWCDGGLSGCTRCGAFEGAWPDECPGVRMTGEQSQFVYTGRLNYRDGAWRDGECCQVMYPTYHREAYLAENGYRAIDRTGGER